MVLNSFAANMTYTPSQMLYQMLNLWLHTMNNLLRNTARESWTGERTPLNVTVSLLSFVSKQCTKMCTQYCKTINYSYDNDVQWLLLFKSIALPSNIWDLINKYVCTSIYIHRQYKIMQCTKLLINYYYF